MAVAAILLAAAGWRGPTAADVPAEPLRDRIVPVLTLRPGETKEVELSSSCARITRGRGLLLREMGAGLEKANKTWSKDGVSASFVEGAAAAQPAALEKKGLKSFAVRVAAAKECKPCLIELHVADETCSGICSTDLRVVIVAP
jgi:hypothetical protein